VVEVVEITVVVGVEPVGYYKEQHRRPLVSVMQSPWAQVVALKQTEQILVQSDSLQLEVVQEVPIQALPMDHPVGLEEDVLCAMVDFLLVGDQAPQDREILAAAPPLLEQLGARCTCQPD
jgi:hypothetical protein